MGSLAAGGWRGKEEKLRLAPANPQQPPPAPQAADRPFAHPYYWSAFILLGDPD
jgi:CHAT domain-containing protein